MKAMVIVNAASRLALEESCRFACTKRRRTRPSTRLPARKNVSLSFRAKKIPKDEDVQAMSMNSKTGHKRQNDSLFAEHRLTTGGNASHVKHLYQEAGTLIRDAKDLKEKEEIAAEAKKGEKKPSEEPDPKKAKKVKAHKRSVPPSPMKYEPLGNLLHPQGSRVQSLNFRPLRVEDSLLGQWLIHRPIGCREAHDAP